MKWIVFVVLAGLFAAAPFLSSRGLGTTEAYNYSLSVADAVTQFRAGVFPVLAGQTEYAFNGRVHPLRTAPYMAYLAGTLDVLTFRQFSFWTLQNLTLAVSLIGGALACYWALRRSTPAEPGTAAILSGLYVSSPAVLAAAYGMDLYMTVMTVPFVPLIVAANLASFAEKRPNNPVLLASSLAACWLAHPPVAFWMTVITLILHLFAACLRRPTVRECSVVIGATLLFLVLAGFSFASALTIAPIRDVAQAHDVTGVLQEVSRNFAASLQPISSRADQLGDFQLGYVGWGLAAGALLLAARRRQWPALALLLAAAFLFTLTAPVPGLHSWLWEHAPAVAINLTNQWPMQRLYLPMTALVLFAFALVWRPPAIPQPFLRDALHLAVAAALSWSLWQSWHFLARGFGSRHSAPSTARGHVSGNIDLTQISYALSTTPDDFVHGVMDPAFSFRLLAPYDAHELGSNWTASLPPSDENRSGTLVAATSDSEEFLELQPSLVLQPGRHYRLSLDFRAPPTKAVLQIRGTTLFREYHLPSAGGPRGFGMAPGNNPALTLWTARNEPEEVSLRLIFNPTDTNASSLRGRPFANYKFDRIDSAALPIELQSLLPLRCRVKAAASGYLETPRMFFDGYEATVNGRAVRAQPSPQGLLMLPVPAGASQVELRYVGPRIVRVSFWLTCLGWFGLVVSCGLVGGPARAQEWIGRRVFHVGTHARNAAAAGPRLWWAGTAGLLLLGAGAFLLWPRWDNYRMAIGPVRIRFVLPRGETNRQQPLLVTGQPHAGTFVYAVYVDSDHIRIGVDVWGLLGAQTDPIKVDYFAEHEVVIDAGALYPVGHPALRHVPPETLARLRKQLTIQFDGETVLSREIETYDSRVGDVTVGRNLIGGSACEPHFAGKILGVQRLPLPAATR